MKKGKFQETLDRIVKETMDVGGVVGDSGDVTQFSADTYATGDSRNIWGAGEKADKKKKNGKKKKKTKDPQVLPLTRRTFPREL